MIKQILNYISESLQGRYAEINLEFEFDWWEIVLILGLIVWVIYLIWR